MRRTLPAFVGLLLLLFALAHSLRSVSAGHPPAQNSSPQIVIGFVGGFISHDNAIHGGVQLAERLRKEYPAQVHVEVFENHRGEQAHQQILRLLDANHDVKLSP